MIARWTSWLAVSMWTVALILGLLMLTLAYAGGSLDHLAAYSLLFVTGMSLTTIGAVLAIHRPGNPLGWIFLVGGLSHCLVYSADRYAHYIVEASPGALPELTLLFWFGAWVWVTAVFLPATFGILLFPTGRPPSIRWRRFGFIAALMMVMIIVAEMLSPGPLASQGEYPEITNPVGIESLSALFDVILTIGDAAGVLLVFIAAGSIFARLRSATAIERQQIKWFAYAALIPAFGFSVYIALLVWPGVPTRTASITGEIIAALGLALIPVAIGIAILRHNLYDIDRLISRTLVYGSLTALLVLGFAGNILLFQPILSPFTSGNDLAIAGSTLVVFALFRPLRDRLQDFVDRRFYRQKYDAEQTLRSFGTTARDAVDLDELTGDLLRVVSATMQPEHVSVWLFSGASGEDRI
jgi:hypothetical protein